MKKSLLFIIVAVALLLVGGGVFAALYFGSPKAEKSVTKSDAKFVLEDDMVFYINVDQLVQKSAINDVLTDGNRSLLATMITADTYDRSLTDYVETLLADLNNTGINTKYPISCYVNLDTVDGDEVGELTLIAEVADANKVDAFFEFTTDALGADVEIVRDGDMRYIDMYDFAIAYNNSRLVVVAYTYYDSMTDCDKLIEEAMARPKVDWSAYAKYDVAYTMQIKPLLDIIRANIQCNIDETYEYLELYADEWEIEWIEEEIESSESELERINNIASLMDRDASITLGLTFENGRVVLDGRVEGVASEYTIGTKVSNDHLAYVGNDVIALLNMGVNGEQVSEILMDNITPEYADMFGLIRNDFNIYFGVLCDAIKSIDGDVTVALYDIYGSSYYGVSSVDAMLAFNVKDDYIISNVAQFGEGTLRKMGDNLFSYNYNGNSFMIGQQENCLFATLNSNFKTQSNPTSKSAWVKDVADSYAYLVVDMDNLMDNSYVSSLYRAELRKMDQVGASYLDDFVESCDYAYVTVDSPTSAQMVLVFDDKHTNSLEHIVRHVMPIVIREATSQMF